MAGLDRVTGEELSANDGDMEEDPIAKLGDALLLTTNPGFRISLTSLSHTRAHEARVCLAAACQSSSSSSLPQDESLAAIRRAMVGLCVSLAWSA